MLSKKSVVVSGMDNIETQSVMNDRCGEKKMDLEYTLDKKPTVPGKITKLPVLPIGFTVNRSIVGLIHGFIYGQGYEIGDKISRFIEDSGLPPRYMNFQEIYNLINPKKYEKLPTWIKACPILKKFGE